MRRRIVFAALLTALLAVLLPVALAGACSCVALPTHERLAQHEAAIVGTVLAVRTAGRDTFATLRVEEAIKGDLAGDVEILTGTGTSCDVSFAPGQRRGVLLFRAAGGGWATGSCSLASPEDLRAARDPFPQAPGAGTAAVIASGDFGGARVAALDRGGRIVAYGAGAGAPAAAVAACRGGQRLVEAYVAGRRLRLAVRRARDLVTVGGRSVPLPAGTADFELRCRDSRARDVVLLRVEGRRVDALRLRAGEWRKLAGGEMDGAGLAGEALVLARGGRVERVTVRTGATRVLARLRGRLASSRITVAAGGRRAAWVTTGNRLTVAGPDGVRSVALAPSMRDAAPAFLPRGRLAVFPRDGATERAPLFDRRLREVGSIDGWTAGTLSVAGSEAWGLGWGGVLQRVKIAPGAKTRTMAALPDWQAKLTALARPLQVRGALRSPPAAAAARADVNCAG